MRDFSKISPAVWQSSRFNSLPSDDGRYLYLYLLTNRHQNSAGCYRLPDGYACTDLLWRPDRYVAARQALQKADMIRFDAETIEVMITRWFKHNPPMNQSHYDGTERILERLESPRLQKPRWRPSESYAGSQSSGTTGYPKGIKNPNPERAIGNPGPLVMGIMAQFRHLRGYGLPVARALVPRRAHSLLHGHAPHRRDRCRYGTFRSGAGLAPD